MRHADHGATLPTSSRSAGSTRSDKRAPGRGERLGRLVAVHHGDEARVKRRLLRRGRDRRRPRSCPLAGTGDTRSSSPAASRAAARDGQREGARDTRQNMGLVREICGEALSDSARFGVHECLRRARRFGVRMAPYDSTGLEGAFAERLDHYRRTRRREARQNPRAATATFPTPLRAAMRNRCSAAVSACGRCSLYASGELCGVERGHSRSHCGCGRVVHAYSLVHDDLPAMDDDDLRRGRPTMPQGLRRGDRDPRRRRAAGPRVRDAGRDDPAAAERRAAS